MDKNANILFDKKILEENLKRVMIPEDKRQQLINDVLSLSENTITKGKKSGTEENVKINVVLPILTFLGYDSKYELVFEEATIRGSIDIAIRVPQNLKTPNCLIECKSWKKDIDKYRTDPESRYRSDVQQGVIYATERGIDWFIISNGYEWRLYKSHISGQIVYNFYEYFDLNTLKDEKALKKFYYLCCKESFASNRLEKLFSETELEKERINEKILEILTECRNKLFTNLITKNRALLTEFTLMEVGQKILDRFVFIRFAEDNNLFGKKILKAFLDNWRSLYSKEKSRTPLTVYIVDLFDYIMNGSKEDNIFPYNGGLFQKDTLLEKMVIDNDILENIIESLYKYPDGKYIDFSEIPIDILGHIYEQYLGISLSIKEKGAKIILKEESTKKIRKKTGIYYTPKYIVNFIIENTVKKKLDESLEILPTLRIVDPACGSGTFLGSAYDLLYDKYKEYNDIILAEASAKEKLLNIDKYVKAISKYKAEYDKKILLDNLYGVDINPESVEITKMSLWFKTALINVPLNDLENNIKCGDSLIDILSLSPVRAFNWQINFPEIFRDENGGFDIIIGNPPYFKIGNNNPLNQIGDYTEICLAGVNAAAVFLNKSLKLLKPNGMLGFIVPKQLAFAKAWSKIRMKLLEETRITHIIDCGKAFENVKLEQVIIVVEKTKNNQKNIIKIGEIREKSIVISGEISQDLCKEKEIVYLDYNPILDSINKKITQNSTTLEDHAEIMGGVGINHLEKQDVFRSIKQSNDLIVLKGWDVQRYYLRDFSYFNQNQPEMVKYQKRIVNPPRKRIVVQRIIAHIKDHIKITACIDDIAAITYDTVISIYPNDSDDIYFILGFLNSNLVSYYLYKFIYNNAIRSMDFVPGYAKKTPIYKADKTQKNFLTNIVKELIKINEVFFHYDKFIQKSYKKYSGYVKTKMIQILKDNFNKLLIPKETKMKVKTIEVETEEDMVILKVNKKRVLKLQIVDEIKRKYLTYYLEGLDPETLNRPNITLIDAFSSLEIDDFNDTKAMKSIIDELKTLDTKEKLRQKILMLEKQLNDTIFQFYQLTSEEIKYIEDSFL